MLKDYKSKFGVGFTAPLRAGRIAGDSHSRLTINSTFRDRFAGVSHTEKIFSGELNAAFVCRTLKDKPLRERAAEFLISGAMVDVIEDIVGSKTWRVGGPFCRRAPLLGALKNHTKNSEVARAILECILPSFVHNGLVEVKRDIYVKVSYPYATPTYGDIIDDFQRQIVQEAVKASMSLVSLKSGVTYATAALAEEISSAFVGLGIALLNTQDFEVVARDMVRGVRARIDPLLTGLKGSVPEDVRDHEAVVFLSTNLVAVNEALSLEKGDSVRIIADGHKFDKWAPTVLAMMRTSERYSIVNRQQYLESIGLRQVRNLKGQARVALLWEDVRLVADSLVVVAVPDAAFPDATILVPSSDRLAEHITASFGDLPNRLTPNYLVDQFDNMIRDAVETGDETLGATGVRHFLHTANWSLETIAMMLCDNLGFRIDDGKVNIVYRLNTEEKFFQPESGSFAAGYLLTTDPVEVLLCYGDKEPSKPVDAPPQFVGRSALRNSIVGLVEGEDYVRINERFSFDSSVLGLKLRGSMRANEVENMKVSSIVSFVRPDFNSTVATLGMQSISHIYASIKGIKDDLLRNRALRNFSQVVQHVCEGVSPAFRQDIHDAIVERSVGGFKPEESELLRARIGQQAVGAVCDVIATVLFLLMQGLVGQEQKDDLETGAKRKPDVEPVLEGGTQVAGRNILLELLADEDLVAELVQSGSDRKGV